MIGLGSDKKSLLFYVKVLNFPTTLPSLRCPPNTVMRIPTRTRWLFLSNPSVLFSSVPWLFFPRCPMHPLPLSVHCHATSSMIFFQRVFFLFFSAVVLPLTDMHPLWYSVDLKHIASCNRLILLVITSLASQSSSGYHWVADLCLLHHIVNSGKTSSEEIGDLRHGVGLRKIAAGRVPHCCTLSLIPVQCS